MKLLARHIPADVTGWHASEKMDGVRAIWTGSALLTRSGKRLMPPAWFLAGLPAGVRLDGEIWMGRGTFPALQSAMQRKGGDWSGIGYHVFDVQTAGTFEERQAILRGLDLPPHIRIVAHRQLTGHAELDAMEREIVAGGGEGVVIVRPGSQYRPGREDVQAKVKRLVADVDRWQG